MRHVSLVIALALIAGLSSFAQPTPTKLDLSWLVGTWEAGTAEFYNQESWLTPTAEGDMSGLFRSVKAGKQVLYQVLAIEMAEDGVYLLARHYDSGLRPRENAAYRLKLVKSGPKELIFTQTVGLVQLQVAYRMPGADQLKVEVTQKRGEVIDTEETDYHRKK